MNSAMNSFFARHKRVGIFIRNLDNRFVRWRSAIKITSCLSNNWIHRFGQIYRERAILPLKVFD